MTKLADLTNSITPGEVKAFLALCDMQGWTIKKHGKDRIVYLDKFGRERGIAIKEANHASGTKQD